jgi:hypothetical protein
MVTRVSGTRSVAPQSGDVTYSGNVISQVKGAINIASSSTISIATEVGDITTDKKLTINDVFTVTSTGSLASGNITNVAVLANPSGIGYNPTTGINPYTGGVIDQTTYSTTAQRKQAGTYFSGGVGIEQDLAVGGFIYGRVAQANTATTSSQVIITRTNDDDTFYPIFTDSEGLLISGATLYADNTNNDSTTGLTKGLYYNPLLGLLTSEKMYVSANINSTSTTTGAFTVTGGVGIGQDVYVGGGVYPAAQNTGTIGRKDYEWADAYMNNIYTRFVGNTNSNITISPNNGISHPMTGNGGIVDVYGDIRVRGSNPIGTAPVVTNVLYVTMDGDDTNDGRAMDPSRACRTIGAAVNSPYYQSGTQIRVAPGLYLEDNPIRLKPYTSIMGSDIRTTGIEPINKTQDLFHVDSGCYIAFCQFLNGRSGLLPGRYTPGTNRGAYCTAFPPLEGDERIDLFHSPYIQNCTNMSGPWLKDGTLFTPNQTVQIPTAVGTGTWAANTTTVVVHISSGTVRLGQAINPGQQNPGFFNARTLLLANKPFLQEQVVQFVADQVATYGATTSSVWYGFNYTPEIRAFCFRDTGIIVENVAYDAAFGGNEKSVEAGIAYWDGVVSKIAGQENQTVNAIQYLNNLALQVIVNTTCTDLLSGTGLYSQVRNTVLLDGDVAASSITSLFSTITNIITNGPDVAPPIYNSTGPDAAFVSSEILMQANRKFIQEQTINKINRDLAVPAQTLPYNKVKCGRDTGIIVDSIATDILYPSNKWSQSTFAGVQYWGQGSTESIIPNELTTTTNAFKYLRDLSAKIVKCVTTATDNLIGFKRYSTTSTQLTSFQPGTDEDVMVVVKGFNTIISILEGDKTGWSDKIIPNGERSNLVNVQNSYNLLIENIGYLKDEVIGYITSSTVGFSYNETTCRRDVEYVIQSVAYDLLHGGNRQSVQSGLSYYGVNGSQSVVENEQTATVQAFVFLQNLAQQIINTSTSLSSTYQTKVKQYTTSSIATPAEQALIATAISTITNIVLNGPAGTTLTPVGLTMSATPAVSNAYQILKKNRAFLVAETLAYLDATYNPGAFKYDQELCYRDTGLIVDAVSQDILLGGNQKSIEAGLAYWNQGYNYVANQVSTTTAAINYARDLSLQIIANTSATVITGTQSTQVINTFFQYGGDYMPQEAVKRNFGIITDIITNGPSAAPPVYAGGGLFALTGINGLDVKLSTRVTSINTVSTGTYLLGLNQPTVGFGNNATIYIGDTLVYPYQDVEVEEISMSLTGSKYTWDSRKVDPIGGMGGSLVDGAVISSRSPIQSFVYDAFTQLTQGGRGVRITNNGYAQLVSVFTIFASVGVQVDNGGIASIVNSNANFGDICLLAKGYGYRAFSGTVYNPIYQAYPPSPGVDGFDQYYPTGFWPNRGTVQVFVPDTANRPHISLVMEVEPPDTFINVQGFPGFLNAQPSTSTLSTGSITLSGVSTQGVAIGNYVYIRDQYGQQYNTGTNDLAWYANTGTYVVDVDYNTITLNRPLGSGGSDPTNPDYFNVYFCGNAYYTVLSSTTATNPNPVGYNLLSAEALEYVDIYGNLQTPNEQVTKHALAVSYLQGLVTKVIANVTATTSATVSQSILPTVSGGGQSQPFIDTGFSNLINIISASSSTYKSVVPSSLITKTGTAPAGAGSAVTLLEANIDYLATAVSAYVAGPWGLNLTLSTGTNTTPDYYAKCERDVKLIVQQLIYDLQSGGNYHMVHAGLSYWSRNGTFHIITLDEAVVDTSLFPDGATVNFYQRSYISASGYVFEYVGAGTNYGSLPQVGRADPVQSKEVVQVDAGKVFFTSTDQNGDFRIGPGLVISQATGVISGRTFTQSLFANMTPFILAIES